METHPELVRRFAEAVAKPGSIVLLLGPDNRKQGWASLDEAILSGQAFAVEVRDNILAVDADSPQSGAYLQDVLTPELEAQGLHPVLVASGQHGHRHLFLRLQAPLIRTIRTQIVEDEKTRDITLDVRSKIRPPLSPHRLGLQPALLHPPTPTAALERLAPPAHDHTFPPLSTCTCRRTTPMPPWSIHIIEAVKRCKNFSTNEGNKKRDVGSIRHIIKLYSGNIGFVVATLTS